MSAKKVIVTGLLIVATYAAARIAYESFTEKAPPEFLPGLSFMGGNMSAGIMSLGLVAGINAFAK